MRAARYTRTGPAADVLELTNMEVPQPRADEVLVAVAVSAVNPHDAKLRAGWLKAQEGIDVVPHGDGAGRIVAIGEDVEPSRLGERVWFFGAGKRPGSSGCAAEHTTVPASHAVRLPDNANYAVGACLGIPALTAHRAVFWDGSVNGRTVLVAGGAGAVAGYAVQFAKADGATVIATVSSPAKAEHARSLGADQTINYREEDVAERMSALLDGAGVDRIIEVDFGTNVALNAKLLKSGGVIAAYSSTREPHPVLPYYEYGAKSATIHFVRDAEIPVEARKAGIAAVTASIESGTLKHTIDSRFAFQEIVAAHERQETGRHLGKVLIDIADVDRGRS
jgi:NADPH2:quinone reductase